MFFLLIIILELPILELFNKFSHFSFKHCHHIIFQAEIWNYFLPKFKIAFRQKIKKLIIFFYFGNLHNVLHLIANIFIFEYCANLIFMKFNSKFELIFFELMYNIYQICNLIILIYFHIILPDFFQFKITEDSSNQ